MPFPDVGPLRLFYHLTFPAPLNVNNLFSWNLYIGRPNRGLDSIMPDWEAQGIRVQVPNLISRWERCGALTILPSTRVRITYPDNSGRGFTEKIILPGDPKDAHSPIVGDLVPRATKFIVTTHGRHAWRSFPGEIHPPHTLHTPAWPKLPPIRLHLLVYPCANPRATLKLVSCTHKTTHSYSFVNHGHARVWSPRTSKIARLGSSKHRPGRSTGPPSGGGEAQVGIGAKSELQRCTDTAHPRGRLSYHKRDVRGYQPMRFARRRKSLHMGDILCKN
ncbi:hypothetical protein B0H11DRAFT_2261313 [Mycena galericulata]|nr:hypothetical protein B0H11DRAFT_2261313 [Mycena galericulata]